jgi:hypothetical protein
VGWAINMFVTGGFAFPGLVLPTQRLLPATYYRVHRPRRVNWLYEHMGGKLFRQFLLMTFWRSKEKRATYFNGRASGLNHLREQTMKAEVGHAIPFLLLTAAAVYVGFGYQKWELAAWIFGFNILGNLYPVLLQRNHRTRLERLLNRSARKPITSKNP